MLRADGPHPGLAGHYPDVALGDVGEEALVAGPVVSEEHRDQDGDGEDEQQRDVEAVKYLGRRDAPGACSTGARLGGVIGCSLTCSKYSMNIINIEERFNFSLRNTTGHTAKEG